MTKAEEKISAGQSKFVRKAHNVAEIAKTMRPTVPLPTSPMKIRAGERLNHQNPVAAEARARAAPVMAGLPAAQARAAEAAPKNIACWAARPSIPSMKLCR